VLGLGLDSELHYFSIFTENKINEHLIFCECHGLTKRTQPQFPQNKKLNILCLNILIRTHKLGKWPILWACLD